MLVSIGDVIVLGLPTRRVKIRDHEYVDLWGWSPVRIGTTVEKGDTVRLSKAKFSSYLSHLKEWSFYYFVPQSSMTSTLYEMCGGGKPGIKIILNVTEYQQNRYDRILSGQLEYAIYTDDANRPMFRTGDFVFLPLIEALDERQAVGLVLEDLLELPQESLPPAWVADVPMEAAQSVDKEIGTKEKELDSVQNQLAGLLKEKADIESHKKLLYASGVELEQAFARCLEMLGGKVSPAKYSQEEFILEYAGGIYLVECKGVGKSIALTHVRQLTDYMLKYEEDEHKEGKGVLFGNAWKDLAPVERGGPETTIFPDNVAKRAKKLDIALVSSTAFFEAFERFLVGKISGDAILQQITSTVGIVQFN